MNGGWRAPLARYGAPLAFLAAATVAVLLVRAGLNAGDRQPPPASSTPTVTRTERGRAAYYRIRRGDTLGGVAARFETTVSQLLALNPKLDPNSLPVGRRLRVR
jgi:LysM repeat protein